MKIIKFISLSVLFLSFTIFNVSALDTTNNLNEDVNENELFSASTEPILEISL